MTLNYNGPHCACCIMPEAEGHITLGEKRCVQRLPEPARKERPQPVL